jgi:hypothetical protein
MTALAIIAAIIALGLCGVLLRKLFFIPASIRWLLAGSGGFVLATLVWFRVFPFLRKDTILSGGKLVSTSQWAAGMAIFLYVGSALFVLIGLIPLLIGLTGRHLFRRSGIMARQRPNQSLQPTAARRDDEI